MEKESNVGCIIPGIAILLIGFITILRAIDDQQIFLSFVFILGEITFLVYFLKKMTSSSEDINNTNKMFKTTTVSNTKKTKTEGYTPDECYIQLSNFLNNQLWRTDEYAVEACIKLFTNNPFAKGYLYSVIDSAYKTMLEGLPKNLPKSYISDKTQIQDMWLERLFGKKGSQSIKRNSSQNFDDTRFYMRGWEMAKEDLSIIYEENSQGPSGLKRIASVSKDYLAR